MAEHTSFRGRHASRFVANRNTGQSAGIAWSHDGGCRSRSGPARGRTGSPGSTEASRWDRTTIATREAAMGGVKFKLVVDSPRPDASARLNAGAYSASWGIRGNCFLSPPLPWNHGWTRLQYTPIVGLNADGSSRLCRCGCSPRCRRCASTFRASGSFRIPCMSNVWSTN